MRPLYHPSVDDITVQGILYALADPVRVQILAQIAAATCPQTCSNFLVIDKRKLPKSTLSQHFKILREAGLVRSERKGVEMHNTTRCDEMKKYQSAVVKEIMSAYCSQNSGATSRRKAAK